MRGQFLAAGGAILFTFGLSTVARAPVVALSLYFVALAVLGVGAVLWLTGAPGITPGVTGAEMPGPEAVGPEAPGLPSPGRTGGESALPPAAA